MTSQLAAIRRHQSKLRQCKKCPDMTGPVVVGQPVVSSVMLIGQAPGNKEIEVGKPFAWTAGKTLFKWFAQIGLKEDQFRNKVYMAAVCRCFPGKNPKGGDRVPNLEEIHHCATWLQAELKILQPQLLLPVGKLAISVTITSPFGDEVTVAVEFLYAVIAGIAYIDISCIVYSITY